MAGEKKVGKDTYLFRENDQPDAMYIVKNGLLAVTKAKGTQEIILAEIGPGQMVGEMALFDLKPRSANVKAIKESEVISLPYKGLLTQLDTLPAWVRAIMRTLNDNIREANKKLRLLESPANDDERWAPHVINRLITIINMVGFKWGTKEDNGISIPPYRLRNFTIQVFHEATNKMTALQMALAEIGYMEVEDLGEGKQRIVNLNPDFLFAFVDWYNDWLFKNEKDRSPALSAEEVKVLNAVLHFAKKSKPTEKGARKINVNDLQNESMKEVGFLVKVEELNSLIEKKFVSEKIMEETGVYVSVIFENIEAPAAYWNLIHDLKRLLR